MDSTGQVRSTNSFYLNSNEPFSCKGTVDSFTYCYFRPSRRAVNINSYSATFAVYRMNPKDTDYNPVSSVFTVSRTQQQINNDFSNPQTNFACSDFILSQPVSVEAGDVFGACIVSPSARDIFRLDMFGRGSTVLRRIRRSTCTDTTVPSSVSTTGATITGTLYIHATVRSDDATTSPNTMATTNTAATNEPVTATSITTDDLATTSVIVNELATTDEEISNTTTVTTDVEVFVTGSSNGSSATSTIAATAIVVSLALAGALATLVVIILLVRRQKLKTIVATNPYPVSARSPECLGELCDIHGCELRIAIAKLLLCINIAHVLS